MIALARHIESLLSEHDCVIVPGLGGFIASYLPAEYSETEHEFRPPTRAIVFNQQLRVNDGLLAQSYMSAYETPYPSAMLQMEKEVEEVLDELDTTGTYQLENIGTLRKDLNHNILYTQAENLAGHPSLCGLSPLAMRSHAEVARERESLKRLQMVQPVGGIQETHTETEPQTDGNASGKDVVIRINRHWLDFAISAAAAVLLFFCLSYPTVSNTTFGSDTVIATLPFVNPSPRPEKTPHRDAEPAQAKTARPAAPSKAEKKHETILPTEAEAGTEETRPAQTPAEAPYTIVLACFVSKSNAETYIGKLNAKGLTGGEYANNGNVSRILYSHYTTEEEAWQELRELRKSHSEFSEAWVLKQ